MSGRVTPRDAWLRGTKKALALAHVANLRQRKFRRVGVPGGDPLDFHSAWTLLSWHGSSFQAALTGWALYAHASMFFGFTVVAIVYDLTSPVPGDAVSFLRFAATFMIVFYSGRALTRYLQRFHDICKTNGAVTLVTCISAAQLKHDKPRAFLLMRYANLIVHLCYYSIGGMTKERWARMIDRGVLLNVERDHLIRQAKKPQHVHVWANRLLDALVDDKKLTKQEAERLEVNISTARGLAAKQIAYHLFTIPKPYFHLMSMVTHLYTVIEMLAAATRVASAWKKHHRQSTDDDESEALMTLVMNIFCACLTIFVVTAMHTVTIWISNPVGDDATDYDLDNDLRNLWAESLEILRCMDDPEKVDRDGGDVHDRIVEQGLKAYHRQELNVSSAKRLMMLSSIARVASLMKEADSGVMSEVEDDMEVDIKNEKGFERELLEAAGALEEDGAGSQREEDDNESDPVMPFGGKEV